MDFVYVINKPGRYACRLKGLRGVDDDYELDQGKSRLAGWPSDGYFEMNEAYPDRLQLEDFLSNRNDLLVLSERAIEVINGLELKNNEVLPVRVINHKGRVVEKKYYILHQIRLQRCIDLGRSEVRPNPLDPDSFISVRRLAMNSDLVDPDVNVFRMHGYPYLPIMRRSLVDGIERSGLTGIGFGEISEWEGK